MKKGVIVFFVTSFIFFLMYKPAQAAKDGVTVGVNVFNPYNSPRYWDVVNTIKSPRWRYLLPFYAKILNPTNEGIEIYDDNQETIDKEIDFSEAAGIDYWSITYWADWIWERTPTSPDPTKPDINHALRLYLSSTHKDTLKFAADIMTGFDKSNWDTKAIPRLIEFMKRSDYQTVLGGRPLVYFYYDYNSALSGFDNNEQKVKDAIARFRKAASDNNIKNPYLVTIPSVTDTKTMRLGFDSTGGYTANWTANTWQGHPVTDPPRPYSELVTANKTQWEEAAQKPYPYVPVMNVSWDNRPKVPTGNTLFYETPTVPELTAHINGAIQWVKNHPNLDPAQTLYIYSWCELPEGGWVVPTIYDGDAHLQAFSKAIRNNYFYTPRFKGRDINGDKKIDMADVDRLKAEFGKDIDPIPNNADITADGKVDIFDYNILLENYGK